LKGIIDYGILYWKEDNIDLETFMDVDWAGNLELKRSTNDYIFKIKNSLVASKNWNRQTIIALSLMDVEYFALMEGTGGGII
jgi:hypothetical protein